MKKNISLQNKPIVTHLALHVSNVLKSVEFYKLFCQLEVVHQRDGRHGPTVWLAENKKDYCFVIVLIAGGKAKDIPLGDFSHLGLAVGTKSEVDRISNLAREKACLIWPAIQAPFPVGYYCGVCDPDGYRVEFSFDQPLVGYCHKTTQNSRVLPS